MASHYCISFYAGAIVAAAVTQPMKVPTKDNLADMSTKLLVRKHNGVLVQDPDEPQLARDDLRRLKIWFHPLHMSGTYLRTSNSARRA